MKPETKEVTQEVNPVIAYLEALPKLTKNQEAMLKGLKKQDERFIPGSEVADTTYNRKHFEAGYELLPIRFDSNTDANAKEKSKDHAKELREQGFQTAYVGLKFGLFGVFCKKADDKLSKSKSLEARTLRAINGLPEAQSNDLKHAYELLNQLVSTYEETTPAETE